MKNVPTLQSVAAKRHFLQGERVHLNKSFRKTHNAVENPFSAITAYRLDHEKLAPIKDTFVNYVTYNGLFIWFFIITIFQKLAYIMADCWDCITQGLLLKKILIKRHISLKMFFCDPTCTVIHSIFHLFFLLQFCTFYKFLHTQHNILKHKCDGKCIAILKTFFQKLPSIESNVYIFIFLHDSI